MKKVFCLVLICFLCNNFIKGQEISNISADNNAIENISYEDSLSKYKDEYDKKQGYYDNISRKKNELSDKKEALNKQITKKNNEILSLRKKYKNSDSLMLWIVKKFIEIPYDDYNVNQLATRAYNNIKDEKLAKQNGHLLEIINNSKDDIHNLITFLESAKNIDCETDSLSGTIENFNQQDFVVRYDKYLESNIKTYLGNIIIKIRSTLQGLNEGTIKREEFVKLSSELVEELRINLNK